MSGAIPQPGDLLLASYRIGGQHATATQQINTAFPLTGGGLLQNNPSLALADAAFLRRGHRTIVFGDTFAGGGASWAVSNHWFALATVQSHSSIRFAGNAGLAGDTVANMLARLNADVVAKRPDKVFLAAGSADIAAGMAPATIAAGISSIVTALKALNILPVICSIPPASQFLAATSKYNLQLRHLADIQGVPFLDLAGVIVDPATGSTRAAYGTDLSNLTGPANRYLATFITAAMASLFDGTPSWVPASDPDGANLIVDGLFLKSPSRWTSAIASGSVALGVALGPDYTISGNIAALTKTDRASINTYKGAPITTGFQPGDRIAFTGRIKTTSENGGLSFDAGLQFSPGINVFYPIYHWIADIQDGQWYAETIVPDGVTSITPFFQLNQGTGTVVIGQVGLMNLTALGIQ